MNEPQAAQLAALATELVAAASAKGLTVRVIGGVGVYLTCPSVATYPALQRAVKDLDLVAAHRDFDAIEQVFTGMGVAGGARDTQRMVFYKDGAEIEVTVPDYRESHRIDLSGRLRLASPTVTIADLLLVKLQRMRFEEKDVQDSIALLLDHAAGDDSQADAIDTGYIARLCARDWGLFRTVYGNTVFLEQVTDKYLEGEPAQRVWRRIEDIQGNIDKQPKSIGWMVNQLLRRPHQVPA